MDKADGVTTWKTLYKIGAVAASLTVLVMVSEIFITLLPGGGARGEATETVLDWFTLFRENPLMGLRNLGLINMIAATLSIPMFFALFIAHRKTDKAYAALALIVFLIGTAVYLASNTAFPMLALSGKYAHASVDDQRSLVAAGETLLAQAESHTPGTFVGFLYSEISSILISVVMLRNRVFSKASAVVGMVGFGFLFIFEILASFVPAWFGIAMVIVMIGGLASITWYGLIARRLFKLASTSETALVSE